MRISDWSSDVCSSDLTVWLITFDDDHDTTIARGENGGRALHNSNVVRALSTLGTWSGEAVTFPLDFAAAKAAGRGGCAVVVQQGRGGPIIGAAVYDLDSNTRSEEPTSELQSLIRISYAVFCLNIKKT